VKLRGFIEKCRSGEIELGTLQSITEEEESSEGRSPRAYRAERGSEGSKDFGVHREGSQTLGMDLRDGKATISTLFRKEK
jgi:hypothetical protein